MDSQTPNSSNKRARLDWLELPSEIMTRIFQKLGVIDILLRAQCVCTSWRKISLEPELWRSVHLPSRDHLYSLVEIAKVATDRSCGQLEAFSVESCCSDEVLQFVTSRCNLRRLQLEYCDEVSTNELIGIAERVKLLEELGLCHSKVSAEVVEAFGNGCPQLKAFRLNYPRGSKADKYALAIAKSMPHLRHLQLFGNKLAKADLRTILDGCPHLESLDLRRCSYLFVDEDLLKRCTNGGITKLRLPNDSIYDYEFVTENFQETDEDEDYEDYVDDYGPYHSFSSEDDDFSGVINDYYSLL